MNYEQLNGMINSHLRLQKDSVCRRVRDELQYLKQKGRKFETKHKAN